jgi:hypothetical protein
MSRKIIAIAAVLAIGILTVVDTTTPLAYAQIVIGPPRDIIDDDIELEQNIACGGRSYTCG